MTDTISEEHTEEGGREGHRAGSGIVGLAEEELWMETKSQGGWETQWQAKCRRDLRELRPNHSSDRILSVQCHKLLPRGTPGLWNNAGRAAADNNDYVKLIHARRYLLVFIYLIFICTNSCDSSKSFSWIFLYFSTKTVVAPMSWHKDLGAFWFFSFLHSHLTETKSVMVSHTKTLAFAAVPSCAHYISTRVPHRCHMKIYKALYYISHLSLTFAFFACTNTPALCAFNSMAASKKSSI